MTARHFNPSKGCQHQSTGVLGALYMLTLAAAYTVLSTQGHATPGPDIFHVWWSANPITIARSYYEIIGFVLLGFLFMVNWEFAHNHSARAYTLMLAISSSTAAWLITGNRADWLFGAEFRYLLGRDWTQLEQLYLLTTLAFVGPWLVMLSQPHRLPPRSPIGWALRSAIWRWLAGLGAFTLVVIITFQHPFYLGSYYNHWRIACHLLYVLYLCLGLPYAFITCLLRGHRYEYRSDPNITLLLLYRALLRKTGVGRKQTRWKLNNKRIGVVLRDLGVKLFFAPLMLTFLFIGCQALVNATNDLRSPATDFTHWRQFYTPLYYTLFHWILIADASLGLIGYLAASAWLNNKSKSVDPTWLGWLITLVCYPPFNSVTGGYLPYQANFGAPYAALQLEWLDPLLKILSLLCFAVFVWCTACFGLRFSNLTNRGIITRGPYALVRHPAYMAKNIAWWFESIQSFASPWQFLFLAASNYIYYLRAITEERHLDTDPDYRAYCKLVRYRFIPRFW